MRPHGAQFAPSAQNRESVMSLGSIAHLQYYFARTGLLDGKGGQMAKKKENGEYDLPKLSLDKREFSESPIDEEGHMLWEAMQEDGEEVMLPPTVSTYSHRANYVPPPPDHNQLKRELVEALENALHAIEACDAIANNPAETPTQGFYELQGLQILDTTTLAIRAARLYYTLHPNPKRLNSIRSDQQIRKELYSVMEVLKKGAARSFAGGFREDERLTILVWVSEVGMMIDQEAKLEETEKNRKKDWHWMQASNWTGKEQERELCFLQFLLKEANPDHVMPTSKYDFFKSLADGRDLIRIHNSAVKISKKHFGQIETFHNDIAKPYRRADNIRFFIKAAELRWDLPLKLNVLSVANAYGQNDADPAIWTSFEETLMEWCRYVRSELIKDNDNEEERKLHARARSLALVTPTNSPGKKNSENIPPVPKIEI